MLGRIRPRLTYANVMATIALFIGLAGGAYAAFQLPNDSVRSKNIVNGQVKQVDLQPAKKYREIGKGNAPPFSDCDPGPGTTLWSNVDASTESRAAFYRDPLGTVHVKGNVTCTAGDQGTVIFRLPAGYRPALHEVHAVAGNTVGIERTGEVEIAGSPASTLRLDEITFRCVPAGQDGCP